MPTSRGLIEHATLGDGDEPAVLVIHGTPGGYDQGLCMALRAGPLSLRVIAPSRPGYLGTASMSVRPRATRPMPMRTSSTRCRFARRRSWHCRVVELRRSARRAPCRSLAALVLISAVTCKRLPLSPLAWRLFLSTVLASDLGAGCSGSRLRP